MFQVTVKLVHYNIKRVQIMGNAKVFTQTKSHVIHADKT